MYMTAPPETALPKRPCLPPGIDAYQRAVDELQIGNDPRHAVVLADLSPRLVAVLRSLDGRTPLARLLARAGEQDAPDLRNLLGKLVDRGLVVDAASPRPPAHTEAAVAVWGDGPLAAGIAGLLASSGVGHVAVRSSGTVTQADLGGVLGTHELGMPRREAIERVLRAASSRVSTGPLPSDCSPDLVILTDSAVPAPEVVQQLMCERQEHMVAAFRDGCGLVGPLVLPGRSSCLRCADLYRADRDPRWPRVANQMVGRVQRADPAATQATVALATAQALAALQRGPEPPQLLDTTMELDLRDATMVHRHWEAHPRCDCGVADP